VLSAAVQEHFGIVPVEAMYSGRPVVACASGGPRESVLDGETGLLCEHTPRAFAQVCVCRRCCVRVA
jgi:alpha-1,3/alpha-1,6-mannosyltransferase